MIKTHKTEITNGANINSRNVRVFQEARLLYLLVFLTLYDKIIHGKKTVLFNACVVCLTQFILVYHSFILTIWYKDIKRGICSSRGHTTLWDTTFCRLNAQWHWDRWTTDYFCLNSSVLIIDHLFPSELILPNTGDEAIVFQNHTAQKRKVFAPPEGPVNVRDRKRLLWYPKYDLGSREAH